MSKYQKGDRVIWEMHPEASGTVAEVNPENIVVIWDDGERQTYHSVWGFSRISLTARLPNPSSTFCVHGGVNNGKHCPICIFRLR